MFTSVITAFTSAWPSLTLTLLLTLTSLAGKGSTFPERLGAAALAGFAAADGFLAECAGFFLKGFASEIGVKHRKTDNEQT